MSYCVNCGVELDPSLKKCPLCGTPVINPNVIPFYESSSPYPTIRGQVEEVRHRDLALLLSLILGTISATCGLLNILVYTSVKWSLLVVGFCVLVWVLTVPALLAGRLSIYVHLLLDGAATSFYLFMISYLTGSHAWVPGLGLPIVVLITVLAEIYFLCRRRLSSSFLFTSLYLFTGIALLCIGIELLCRRYLHRPLQITWSAIVLTVCSIFLIGIITLLLRPALRDAVRRRMHF